MLLASTKHNPIIKESLLLIQKLNIPALVALENTIKRWTTEHLLERDNIYCSKKENIKVLSLENKACYFNGKKIFTV
jgi:hypothetical protein